MIGQQTDRGREWSPGIQIYPNVHLGAEVLLEDPVIIGKPPLDAEPGELSTSIGDGCVVRPFTTIYAGTSLGSGVQTGQGASIREDNVIEDQVSIGTRAVLEFGNRIGHGSRIHSGCFLEMAVLEEWVFLGPNVVLTDDPHPMGCPKWRECRGGVTVKRGARLGAGAVVLPGVTIGVEALVGAGSVVTHDVPAKAVVVGNPAHVIGTVDELTCDSGFFERPYAWSPYAEPAKEEQR